MNNEFITEPYDLSTVPLLNEFLYRGNKGLYTKYNFNFDLYSQDFNVFGSKLMIFTDFNLRMNYLSGNALGFIGFQNIPSSFDKYFDLTESGQKTLLEYLKNSSIYSPFKTVAHSLPNIDYSAYVVVINSKYNNLNLTAADALKYFLKNGQFQQDSVPFISPLDDEIIQLSNSVCTVFTKNMSGTGFLVAPPPANAVLNNKLQVNLLTCYHLIAGDNNKDTIFVSVALNGKSIKLQFKVIGYDIHTDILVATYDPTLDYNLTFFPDEDNIRANLKSLTLNCDVPQYIGQTISMIGNPGLIDNNSFISGIIMDPKYSGDFNQRQFLASPTSILSTMHIETGVSGSPLFVKDETTGKLVCMGMVNSKLGQDNQYSMAISSVLFFGVYKNAIGRWVLSNGYNNDINLIRKNVSDIFPLKWLGCRMTYYNPANSESIDPAFNSFPYAAGVIINQFVLGFNNISRSYVTQYDKLSEQGVIQINTPFLNSKIYQRYSNNNQVPIVLLSVELYDRVKGQYSDFLLGKYLDENSLSLITYEMAQSATVLNEPKYTNKYLRQYAPITFKYAYYNGKEWLNDVETIGGNSSDWYNVITGPSGDVYKQHVFEYPLLWKVYLGAYFGGSKVGKYAGKRECGKAAARVMGAGGLIASNRHKQYDDSYYDMYDQYKSLASAASGTIYTCCNTQYNEAEYNFHRAKEHHIVE